METGQGFASSSVSSTYRRLRGLASAALIGLPLITALSAFIVEGRTLEPSLSDYYFAIEDGGLPRALLTVFLAILGGILVAYRGLDREDNRIHNAAGLFAFGVALFPMQCNPSEHQHCVPGLFPLLHLPSAGLLYLSAIASVLYGGGPKLKAALRKLPHPTDWLLKLNIIRFSAAALMTVGIGGFFIHALFPKLIPGFSWVFWIEYTGFFGFGLYWFRLMRLVDAANAEGRKQQTIALPDSREPDLAPRSVERRAPHGDAAARTGTEWVDIP